MSKSISSCAMLARFARDRNGSFLLVFALLLLPLIALLGLAVDYALLNRCKTQLDATNDAAVLAAATAASETIQAETTTTSNQTTVNADASTAATAAYNSFFQSDSARARTAAVPTYTPTVSISGLVITVNGVYSAQSPNIFGRIFGTSLANVSGTSTASVTLPKYVNIYVVYDDSQSEGLGSTPTDMSSLQALTVTYPDADGVGCQFGCHASKGSGYPTTPYENIAHSNNITLRIDSIRSAIVAILNAAQTSPTGFGGAPRIQFAFYSMDETLNKLAIPSVTSQPSSDYTDMLSYISRTPAQIQTLNVGPIDLESAYVNSTGPGDSYQPTTLAQLAQSLPTDGDGSSANAPVNYVFIMTDGVTDKTQSGYPDGHNVTYINPTVCSNFTGKAVVDVIYTQYLDMPSRSEWQLLIQPIATQIAPAMQQCSQNGDAGGQYILATDGPDIVTAAQTLFNQAVASERLLQ